MCHYYFVHYYLEEHIQILLIVIPFNILFAKFFFLALTIIKILVIKNLNLRILTAKMALSQNLHNTVNQ